MTNIKIRTDFVTNSSSSSFIIRNCREFQTVEDIYSCIRNLYIEWLNLTRKVKKETGCNKTNCYELNEKIEKKYGISAYDLVTWLSTEWVNCLTYTEYLSFWNEQNQGERYAKLPFEILTIDEADKRGILSWYAYCLDEDYSCKDCYIKNKGDCKKIKNNDFTAVFGKFCVSSESGYIPNYITDKLCEMSSYSCKHMG